MYYISEFCRVCFQYEKPLVDIIKEEAENETLVNKLKLCVSEIVRIILRFVTLIQF